MNGSEPPSSRTLFFRACPAVDATDMPAFSLPVRVTAAIRGSSMSAAMSLLSMKRLVKAPAGRPARRKMSSRRSAVCGTFDACLSRPTLPTISAGAAKRTTCHSGKFHGMMARTGADRLVVHIRTRGAGGDRFVRQQRLGVLGEPAQAHGALRRLGAGGGERLAHLGGHDAGDVGPLALEEVGRIAEVAGPFGEAGRAVLEEGVEGLLQERLHLGRGVCRKRLLGLTGGGIDRGVGHDRFLPQSRARPRRPSPRCSGIARRISFPVAVCGSSPVAK